MEEAVVCLTERLHEKYLEDDDESDIIIQSFLSGSPIKSAARGALNLVVLNHTLISRCGEISQYAGILRHVSEIDLAWNRLHSWAEIATLLRHAPSLRTLNLSHNPLSPELGEDELPRCPQLSSLILNGTDLPMTTLRNCAKQMPALRELHLSDNAFDEGYFDAFASGWKAPTEESVAAEDKENAPISESVRTLHVNRCKIARWSDVISLLHSFPSTEIGFFCDNPIKEIRHKTAPTAASATAEDCPPSASTSGSSNVPSSSSSSDVSTSTTTPTATASIAAAKNLRTLNISKTSVRDWHSIEALESWPNLADLRINNIPLLEDYSEEERLHLVVGRIDRLKVLNGSPITKEQRETSERFFVRYYDEKQPKPQKYDTLLQKHGKLEKLAKVDLSPKTHAKVSIVCEETGYSATVNLRLSRTIAQFMRSLEKATSIPYARMRLFYWDPTDMQVVGGPGPTEIRFPNQLIYMLHIEDGGMFRVQSKLIPNRKRAQAKETH